MTTTVEKEIQRDDVVEDELQGIDPSHPVLTSVGAPPTSIKWQKVSHRAPMASLNKVNSISELGTWLRAIRDDCIRNCHTIPLSWSEKLDGISVVLLYEKGELVSAVTRGDGSVGEDIIANVVLMRGVLRTLNHPITGWVRGEIILTHDLWETKFPAFSNPRNAAAGIAKRESREEAQDCQYLTVMAFDFHSDMVDIANEEEKFFFLKNELGFKVPNHGFNNSSEGLDVIYSEYDASLREDLHYDIDGLVVRLQDAGHYVLAGVKGGNPNGAVALRFDARGSLTTLRSIVWNTGNTGRVTPVAEFDSVNLDGVVVSWASLHNTSNIQDLNLSVGDTIRVVRANDVIPQVEKVVAKGVPPVGGISQATASAPSTCPSCDAVLLKEDKHLICRSVNCPATCVGRLAQWLDEVGIMGWGPSILESLVEEGSVRDIPDLYWIPPYHLADIKRGGVRVGEVEAQRLIVELQANAKMTLATLLGGIGMEGIRRSTVQKIIGAGYTSLTRLRDCTFSELVAINGIGPTTVENFMTGLYKRGKAIDSLISEGYVTIISDQPSPIQNRASGNVAGLRFALTGAMSKVRADIEQDIENAGGEVGPMSVKGTDYLVAADINSSSLKIKKAKRHNIPIIDEAALYQMLKHPLSGVWL